MTGAGSTVTESLLRRDRRIVATGLLVLAGLAWAYVLAGAGTGMSAWEMTVVSLFPHRLVDMPMEGMSMEPGAWTPGYWAIVVLMWWVMMIAMMTPSAAPIVLLYARAARHAQASGQLAQGIVPTAAFAAGYLLVWLGFSVAAAALQLTLEGSGALSAVRMGSTGAGVSAAILLAAGLYQLSPLKDVCLRNCRAPAQFLVAHYRPGAWGAVRMGAEHGAYCVGCCALLMGLLFVGGVMNVLWIAALAILVLGEKLAPAGRLISRLAGVALLGWGAATLLV